MLSIESQRRELLEFAKKNGLQVVKIFEESQSAYKLGRPIFTIVMEMIADELADAILTWKPDRLARNALDGGKVIQAMDDKKLMEIRTPYECFRQEDNRMLLYIHFGMSNDYSRQISANVKRGNRQKYARGEFVGKAPLGYLNSKVGNSSNIVLDPEKAPFVRKLFEEFSTGKYSVQDLVRKADSWGLRSVFNHKIAKSGMYTLLRRTAYYGVYIHADEPHQGSYESLVTKGLFDRVQEVLEDRGKPRKKDWTHTYKTLVKCAECGCSITATTKEKYYKKTRNTGIYTYYYCTKRRGKCSQKPITEEEMEEMMRDYILKIDIDKEVWEIGIELLRAKHQDEMDKFIEASKRLEKEKEGVKRDLQKLLDMRLREEISAEEYTEAKKLLLDKKVAIEEKLTDKEESSDNWLELAENFFETCYRARKIMQGEDYEKKRDLIECVGWNLFLNNKKLEFSFKKPYNILLKPEVRSDVQARQDSNLEERFWRPP